jgi:hypothetical protein
MNKSAINSKPTINDPAVRSYTGIVELQDKDGSVIMSKDTEDRNDLSRTRVSKMHKEEDFIDRTIAKTTQGTGVLLKESANAGNNIFVSGFDKLKEVFNTLESEPSGKTKTIKKLLLGGGAVAFTVAALKSTLDFLKHLFDRKSKTNGLLKFADASIKWFLGVNLFRTFTGSKKGIKFDNLKQILVGAGASLFVSQLTGVNEGKRNLLRTLSKVTGSEDTLNTVSGYNPLIVQDTNNSNLSSVDYKM